MVMLLLEVLNVVCSVTKDGESGEERGQVAREARCFLLGHLTRWCTGHWSNHFALVTYRRLYRCNLSLLTDELMLQFVLRKNVHLSPHLNPV